MAVKLFPQKEWKKPYQWVDDVSLGSCLGPLFSNRTNRIMTKLVKNGRKRLVGNSLMMKLLFYVHYGDDTLMWVKPKNSNLIQNALNNFDSYLQFTIASINAPNILDFEIHPDGIEILFKMH